MGFTFLFFSKYLSDIGNFQSKYDLALARPLQENSLMSSVCKVCLYFISWLICHLYYLYTISGPVAYKHR